MARRRRTRRRAARLVAGALLIAVAVGVVAAETRDRRATTTCAAELRAVTADRGRVTLEAEPSRPGVGRVTPERGSLALPQSVDNLAQALDGAAELAFAIGGDREPVVRRQPLKIPEGLPMERVAVTAPFGDVVDAEGRPLPAAQVQGAVTQRGPGRLLTVGVCVDPSRPSGVRPGDYRGTALVGVGAQTSAVALHVTLKDDRWWRVLLAALLGVAAGLFVKLFADNRSTGLPDTFRENLWSARTLTALGVGAATAVYSYLTIYADDPTFIADAANLWRVSAEAFAGTLAAKALTDIARPPAERAPVAAA